MCDFLETFVTEKRAAEHEQRRDDPREYGAEEQGGGHHDQLVYGRTLEHRPHYGQFALGANAGDLLRVECEVVAQHAGRLLRGHLGHQGDVVEYGGNIVE